MTKSDDLAIELFESGIYEGKILCAKIFNPKKLTEKFAEHWIKCFDNWEICDTFCMMVFAKSPLAYKKIFEWAESDNEFEKRAAFATMAAFCIANKKAINKVYLSFFSIIVKHPSDDRIYVKNRLIGL